MALVRRWGRTTVARSSEIILSFLYRVEEITTCTFWDIDIIHWDIVHYPVDEILGIDIDASDDKAARLLWKARPTQVGRGISSSIRASFGYPSNKGGRWAGLGKPCPHSGFSSVASAYARSVASAAVGQPVSDHADESGTRTTLHPSCKWQSHHHC